MKNLIFNLLLLFVIAPTALVAQPLISVAELVKIQKNPDLVIVSAGTDAEYAKAHITNAVQNSW
jgi:3-mercaptopyruvate sulfurtransferase SseA